MQKYTCGARQNNEQIRVQMGISPFLDSVNRYKKSRCFDHIHQWSSAEQLKHYN